MPVTGPFGPGAQLGAAGQPVSQTLQSMLAGAGLMGPGVNPMVVAKNLLSRLGAKGFGGKNPGASLENQLGQALSAFQKANGLKTTGTLNKTTMAMLRNIGMIGVNPRASAGVVGVKDGFERAMIKAPGQQADGARADQGSLLNGLRNLLEARLGGPGRAIGNALAATGEQISRVGGLFARMGEGIQNAVSNLVTGAGARADAEVAAQAQLQAQAQAKANPANVAAHGLVQSRSKTEERSRAAAAFARKANKGRGVEVGDPLAAEGVGDESGHRGLLGGGEGEEGAPEDDGDGDGASVGPPDDEVTERFVGNADSGDENFADASRGHATLDDGSGADAGHYSIPPVSQQIEAALGVIQKDPARSNQPTTYSWDVRLYRPDVYGEHQKAEELFHLEVRNADAFDPVWEKSLQALARYLRRFEKQAEPPDLVAIQAALRRARVRDG